MLRMQVLVAMALVLGACTSKSPVVPPVVTSLPFPTILPSPSAPGLQACPLTHRFEELPVFARGLGAPDDLVSLRDGTLWVSDPVHGVLIHLDRTGQELGRIHDPDAPEGMVELPDGRLIVAEQRRNRLVALRPPSSKRTVVFRLPSAGAGLGLDGIAYDAARERILVPDSPHRMLIAWTVGGRAHVLARELGRVVGAAVGPDGAIYVAAEASPGLFRVPAQGGDAQPFGGIIQADDVVSDGMFLYVTLIGLGQVVALEPVTGARRVLVDGITAAQGLALLADHRLVVTDSAAGVIALVESCKR